MIYIGIDPGVSGGISCLDQDGAVRVAVKMPLTERDILDALRGCLEPRVKSAPTARVYLERVSASPQMGVTSAFTFGRGFGGLRMAVAALNLVVDEVRPQKWQPAMGCLTGGDKNISKRRAQQLFPTVKVTHALADSLLICEYGRRLHTGTLSMTYQV